MISFSTIGYTAAVIALTAAILNFPYGKAYKVLTAVTRFFVDCGEVLYLAYRLFKKNLFGIRYIV